MRTISPARDLNFRLPVPGTNALLLDLLAGTINLHLNELQYSNTRDISPGPTKKMSAEPTFADS